MSPAAARRVPTDGGVAACEPLPIIGSLSRVFAYFTLNPPDPRVK